MNFAGKWRSRAEERCKFCEVSLYLLPACKVVESCNKSPVCSECVICRVTLAAKISESLVNKKDIGNQLYMLLLNNVFAFFQKNLMIC
ncbi:MAG: hypothetical protein PWQ17_954 [Anaerophaga sp.]|nr:hypothetical protein [Anaerophaga sp.]MDK2841449.1 hypothetical protein [Anaerophaga sp.]MDN5290965.1 hypothetical protein [Anaerophaga sp.]